MQCESGIVEQAARAPTIADDAMFKKGWPRSERLGHSETPVDPELPQLERMLDAEAMLPLLRSHAGSDVSRCRIVNLRYRPGIKCQASYRLDNEVKRAVGQPYRFVTVSAESASRFERKLPGRVKAAERSGVPFDYVSGQAMVLATFPHDADIHTLRALLTGGGLDRIIGTLSSSSGGPDFAWRQGGEQHRVVSYRPGRSCLVRCMPPHADPAPGSPIYARTYCDDRGARVFDSMCDLWHGADRHRGRLSVAQPLAYDASTHTLVHAAVPGDSTHDLGGIDPFLRHCGNIAGALVAIHRARVGALPVRSPESALRWANRMRDGLAAVNPAIADRLDALLRALQSTAPDRDDSHTSVLHGDFSLNQVLLHRERVSIIDFDDVCVGDRCADVGTFLARLEARLSEAAAAHAAASAFRRDYERQLGARLDDDRLRWYQGLAFVRLGLSALSQLRPGWPARLDRQWRYAARSLGQEGL